ncbi:MAG: hypothetical protein K9G64_08840 [Bacteroidia bacterium]|nr:hypothetical protein [Bacteroidia bacterium]
MKAIFINILFVFIIITSCNNDEIDRDNNGKSVWVDTSEKFYKPLALPKTEDFDNIKYKSEVDTNVYIKGFNLEKSRKFLFSNNEAPDEFKVIVKGFKIYSSTIEFTITTKKGKQIYYDNFPVNGILANAFDGDGEYATNIQKEEFLRKWIVLFLSNESFLTPAIIGEREFFAEHSNKVIWDIIAADANAIGFVYSKKNGSQTEVAFDKKLNKVLTYYEY